MDERVEALSSDAYPKLKVDIRREIVTEFAESGPFFVVSGAVVHEANGLIFYRYHCCMCGHEISKDDDGDPTANAKDHNTDCLWRRAVEATE